MTPSRWKQVEEIHQAARMLGPAERREFLKATDVELRHEVEVLLAGENAPGDATQIMAGVGAQLGPYKIEASIGKGGMGEVFRAVDTRLGRKVAIKTSTMKFDARFEREARAISSLNHPHICTLHDVGPGYIVMELVEGETLSSRFKNGKLSMREVLTYGSQIASALAEAHSKAITHRDLKPGNVMLCKNGVKVLDFGLAKLHAHPDDGLTQANAVMGTPAYMAPEQRAGKPCDARTDIYALGLILFEMATGKRHTSSDPLVDITALPERLAHIIEKSLIPDPDLRWQSAADVGSELAWAGVQPTVTPAIEQLPKSRGLLTWAIGATATTVVVSGLLWTRAPAPSDDAFATRFTFAMPKGTVQTRNALDTTVSPDGHRIAFVSRIEGGSSWLWIRTLDSEEVRKVEGSEGATNPFWSPDGQDLAFFAAGKLKRTSAAGGPVQNICTSMVGLGGAWSPTGEIIFNPVNRSALARVAATGGTPMPFTQLSEARKENSHRWPSFLPDGRHFLFTARSSLKEDTAVYVGSLDSKEVKRVLTEQSQAIFSGGYLLFGREGNLLAQRFDLDKLEVSGKPSPVTGNIDFHASGAFTFFAASPNGRALTYSQPSSNAMQLTWLNRKGAKIETIGPPEGLSEFALSPNGRRLALTRTDADSGNRDLWLMELATGVLTRFTSNPANDWRPIWSPDGEWIAFASDRTPQSSIWRKAANGNTPEEMIVPPVQSGGAFPQSWSPDGKSIAYYLDRDHADTDIWLVSTTGDGKTKALLASDFREWSPRFSPDGKWLAYTSNETGTNEVYVRAIGSPRAYRISSQGGDHARWRSDGRELFFVGQDLRLMAANITFAETVRTNTPTPLFNMCSSNQNFEVTADGQRFIVACRATTATDRAVTVLSNWRSMLK